MENQEKNRYSTTLNLVLGIFFLLFGCYRVYKYLNNEVNTVRLILGLGFIGYSIFILYKYFKHKND
ncbi:MULTISPECIES: hypothetical protein [Mesoflavibacter]|uniref:Uncharacterized protein n=1 Tax=Mesoflavibacter profundi TaxID=2708110 RepID=A0ABT4RWP0_9FLAO|nr:MULTISPECIES: hypothetical protein [Mesoflavibacter]MDA0176247.1 hypothetical protein [Mesoflavibacter profundi]QIJ89883.1 hypothetical protein C7H62_2075 [Mesoflavibacter sp. HG96]QIJ92611.1 hypothetical protein C7H56_2075 [Mesoflavibacter sp. HG37]